VPLLRPYAVLFVVGEIVLLASAAVMRFGYADHTKR
jgi:hypothetical protein